MYCVDIISNRFIGITQCGYARASEKVKRFLILFCGYAGTQTDSNNQQCERSNCFHNVTSVIQFHFHPPLAANLLLSFN